MSTEARRHDAPTPARETTTPVAPAPLRARQPWLLPSPARHQHALRTVPAVEPAGPAASPSEVPITTITARLAR